MLVEIARRLDEFVAARNAESRSEGLPTIEPCAIRVYGQAALIEAGVRLSLAATKDIDATGDLAFPVEQEFRRLLSQAGRELDPLAGEIWMPKETTFSPLYEGHFVTILLADPDAVLISKALKAPRKNQPLITEYLARGASTRFFALARKYKVDLEQFL